MQIIHANYRGPLLSAEIGEAAGAWTLARAIDSSVGQNSARSLAQ